MKVSKNKKWNEIKTNDSWSIFKIMGEFVEGYEKLSAIGPCISIFGSARTKPEDKYYKLDASKPCKTITSHMRLDCNMYIHPTQPRGLSPREAARIQTFPDHYFFLGSQNSWYHQIGNSVPVVMSRRIAEAIKDYL